EAPPRPLIDPQHDQRWIRATLHVWQRALQHGWITDPEDALNNVRAGLSPGWQYLQALADETIRMRHAPVCEILATPEPHAFTELWAQDIARRTLRAVAA